MCNYTDDPPGATNQPINGQAKTVQTQMSMQQLAFVSRERRPLYPFSLNLKSCWRHKKQLLLIQGLFERGKSTTQQTHLTG
jgi:hypothetical protein